MIIVIPIIAEMFNSIPAIHKPMNTAPAASKGIATGRQQAI
ncbi:MULTISPECIES: hypothetical protein [Paraburkholderia]|nr:hypothetical protein [Paraburkholderia caledonica]